nr:hypothetical protein [uncultured Undibacterium sp.]
MTREYALSQNLLICVRAFQFCVMRLKASAFTSAQGVREESDIQSLTLDSGGLVIIVARERLPDGRVQGLRIWFRDAAALRYLDEVELARYWSSEDFPRGHHVLEVQAGGWSEEESALQGYATKRREWLVVTGNGCVSVFASSKPETAEVFHEFDA